jgi:hypothetical protein
MLMSGVLPLAEINPSWTGSLLEHPKLIRSTPARPDRPTADGLPVGR